MSNFLLAFKFASLFLPEWLVAVIIIALVAVCVLIVVRIIGAVLDAIPFV